MSLVPGEQRTLTEIESGLRKSDPELAAMFARLPDGRARTPCRRRASIVILVAICTLFFLCLAIALVAAAHAGTRTGGLSPYPGHGSAHSALP